MADPAMLVVTEAVMVPRARSVQPARPDSARQRRIFIHPGLRPFEHRQYAVIFADRRVSTGTRAKDPNRGGATVGTVPQGTGT